MLLEKIVGMLRDDRSGEAIDELWCECKEIGSGAFSDVFLVDGVVVKWVHRKDSGFDEFVKFCSITDSIHVPTFIDQFDTDRGKFYLMEHYEDIPHEVAKRFDEFSDSHTDEESYGTAAWRDHYGESFDKLLDELDEYFLGTEDIEWDLHDGNVMVDHDGNFVIIDPWCAEHEMCNFSAKDFDDWEER